LIKPLGGTVPWFGQQTRDLRTLYGKESDIFKLLIGDILALGLHNLLQLSENVTRVQSRHVIKGTDGSKV
jgi:hypothetical protein